VEARFRGWLVDIRFRGWLVHTHDGLERGIAAEELHGVFTHPPIVDDDATKRDAWCGQVLQEKASNPTTIGKCRS
jgi:hypothetical protein